MLLATVYRGQMPLLLQVPVKRQLAQQLQALPARMGTASNTAWEP
ncbi:hypothetical protein V1331_12145 (plasmid) [Levilactobacillus brevis]|nr:hypothetical protein [Levilactobacillus brevis]